MRSSYICSYTSRHFVNVFTSVRWLRSATITLLPDNRTVSVLCDVNESSPPVNCCVTVNCTTCELVISKVFTGSTELSVSPLNNYSISVQVIRSNGTAVEDFNIVDTLSVPESSGSGSSCKFVIPINSIYLVTKCFQCFGWVYLCHINTCDNYLYLLQCHLHLAILRKTLYFVGYLPWSVNGSLQLILQHITPASIVYCKLLL